MSERAAVRSRQRRRETKLAPNHADLVICHVAAARSAETGSPEAVSEAQLALFHLMQDLRPALGDYLSQQSPEMRLCWMRTLQFLLDAHIAPQLRSLVIGLGELDRGVVVPGLTPKAGGRQGGLSGTEELRLMSFAIEAANELRRRCTSSDEYRAELLESETSFSTISGYRKAVRAGPKELWPRSSYILNWGDQPPEMLLQQVIWALRDYRKKPRKIKNVETSG